MCTTAQYAAGVNSKPDKNICVPICGFRGSLAVEMFLEKKNKIKKVSMVSLSCFTVVLPGLVPSCLYRLGIDRLSAWLIIRADTQHHSVYYYW